MIRLSLKPAGTEDAIEIRIERGMQADRDHYVFHANESSGDVEHHTLSPGAGWLRLNGFITPYYAMRRGNTVRLWLDGRTHDIELVDRRARRAGGDHRAAAADVLTAPMPGTILKINVGEGDAFAAHDPLIIMESMKMEMTLSAHHAGRIKSIQCEAGQLVEMGALLAKLSAE